MSDTILGTGAKTINRTKIPLLMEFTFYWGESTDLLELYILWNNPSLESEKCQVDKK